MKLAGRVVWIVGASSGIGAATGRELAQRGARVAVTARREQQLREIARGEMLVVPADVTAADSIAQAAATVVHTLGPLELVVYSAGYWQQMDATAWDPDVYLDWVHSKLSFVYSRWFTLLTLDMFALMGYIFVARRNCISSSIAPKNTRHESTHYLSGRRSGKCGRAAL